MEERPFGKKAGSTETRKFPRFRAKPLHSLSLHIQENDPQIKIANISNGGLGLFSQGIKSILPEDFEATLVIASDKFKVQIRKIFEGEEIIGCQFQNPSSELQACIDRYFETELLALKLSRVETKPGRNNHQDKIIFFHGQNNCELLINERNSQVCYFSVIVLGNSVEVDPRKSVLTGQRVENKSSQNRQGVFLFKPQKTSTYIIENAIRFIDNIEALTIDYRQNLIRLLNETLAQNSPEKQKASGRTNI
jgi:hypothetical protein